MLTPLFMDGDASDPAYRNIRDAKDGPLTGCWKTFLGGRDAQHWLNLRFWGARKIRHRGTLDSKITHHRPIFEFFSSLLGGSSVATRRAIPL